MIKESELTETCYKTGEVARLLNVSTRTVQNYDRAGKMEFTRSFTGRRLILREKLIEYLEKEGLLDRDLNRQKRDVIYARVSTNEQKKKGELDRQAVWVIEHVPDLQNPLILKEVGSGLNDNRPKLMQLIDMVMANEVRNVYITYKDRLTRFGFHYLEKVFRAHMAEIIVLRDQEEGKSIEQELTNDMMSLIASFSGKLYGMRSHRRRKESCPEK